MAVMVPFSPAAGEWERRKWCVEAGCHTVAATWRDVCPLCGGGLGMVTARLVFPPWRWLAPSTWFRRGKWEIRP